MFNTLQRKSRKSRNADAHDEAPYWIKKKEDPPGFEKHFINDIIGI